jgi:DNA-binding transcriptional LysR family regulator
MQTLNIAFAMVRGIAASSCCDCKQHDRGRSRRQRQFRNGPISQTYARTANVERDDLYEVLDLKALRCFWAMGKYGSLTRAGIELGISESAVSQRVKALEQHVGQKLYEAPGGRMRLTPSGQQVMDMAVALFDRLQQFQQEIVAGGDGGALSIATQEATLRYLLPPIVQRMTREHADLRLRIMSRRVADTLEMVRAGDVDLGIVSQASVPDSLAFYPWKTFGAFLLLPIGHPLLRRGRPPFKMLLTRENVLQYPLIVPERGDPAHSRVAQALEELGLPFNVAFEVGTIDALKQYVRLGLGIAVVSGICLTEEDQGRLEWIPIPAEFHGSTTYGAVLRKGKYLSAPLRTFLGLAGIQVKAPGGTSPAISLAARNPQAVNNETS